MVGQGGQEKRGKKGWLRVGQERRADRQQGRQQGGIPVHCGLDFYVSVVGPEFGSVNLRFGCVYLNLGV